MSHRFRVRVSGSYRNRIREDTFEADPVNWACVRADGPHPYGPDNDGDGDYAIFSFAENSGIDTCSPNFGLTTGGHAGAGHLI